LATCFKEVKSNRGTPMAAANQAAPILKERGHVARQG
jgi:hypothetical protein